jgi:hypothetical protein
MRAPMINAVELVRSIREAHHAALQGTSTEEKIAFFREKARALHAELGARGNSAELLGAAPDNLPPLTPPPALPRI